MAGKENMAQRPVLDEEITKDESEEPPDAESVSCVMGSDDLKFSVKRKVHKWRSKRKEPSTLYLYLMKQGATPLNYSAPVTRSQGLEQETETVIQEAESNQDQVVVQSPSSSIQIMAHSTVVIPNAINLDKFDGSDRIMPQIWWTLFEQWATLHKFKDEDALCALPFQLTGHAQTWYHSLDPIVQKDLNAFKAAFISRFTPTTSNKKLLKVTQGASEKVNDYLMRVQSLALNSNLIEDIIVGLAVEGLTNNLKGFVTGKDPKTFSELRSAVDLAVQVSDCEKPTAESLSVILKEIKDSLKAEVLAVIPNIPRQQQQQQQQQPAWQQWQNQSQGQPQRRHWQNQSQGQPQPEQQWRNQSQGRPQQRQHRGQGQPRQPNEECRWCGDTRTKAAWTTFKLVIDKHDGTSQEVNFTASLHPARMQYLFQHHRDTVKTQMNNKGVQIKEIGKGYARIKVESKTDHIDEILGEIVSTLEDAASKIITKVHPMSDESMRSVVLREAVGTSGQMNVIIYDDGNSSIVLVGEAPVLNTAYERLKQITEEKQKKTREIDIGTELNMKVIQNLDFQGYLNSKKSQSFKIDTKNHKLIFDNSSKEEINTFENLMHEFLSTITVTVWKCPPSVTKLLTSPAPQMYIQNRLQDKHLKCLVSVEDNTFPEFRTLSAEDGKCAIAIVQTSFQNIQIDRTTADSSRMRDIFEKYKTSYTMTDIDDSVIEITATNDVILKLMTVMVEDDVKKAKNTLHTSDLDPLVYCKRGLAVDTDSIQPSTKDENLLSSHSVIPVTDSNTFTTPEGLNVLVYTGDILYLNVECIVNPANECLGHGGGMAYAIARAAGHELDRESKEYIRKYGNLRVGKCCYTTAGNLKYKYVIHTVGPRWDDYKDKQQCEDDLCSAVEKALEMAEQLQLASIAIPSISSGIFGVPKPVCAQQYLQAVEKFSKSTFNSMSCLKEVHFIDRDVGMCSLVKQTFSDNFKQNSSASATTLQGSAGLQMFHIDDVPSSISTKYFQRSLSSSSSKSVSRSSSINENETFEFNTGSRLKLYVCKGNITKTKVDSIVCPEDKNVSGYGGIAKYLMEKGGEKYRKYRRSFKSLNYIEVESMNVENVLPYKRVFFVWPPQWDATAAKKPYKFEADLTETVYNILQHAEDKSMKSVVIPFLGRGHDGKYTTPIKTCGECMVTAVHNFCKKQTVSLTEVYFVMNDPAAFSGVKDECYRKFGAAGSQNIIGTSNTSHLENFGSSLGSSTKEGQSEKEVETASDYNCCICMDSITKPKKLACGHVFCTDCIDQTFQYKPACPNCGKVFGKVTGDQPYGRMEVNKKPWVHLAGYERHGTIEVCYTIPIGEQTSDHPSPGRPYEGIYRSGYLPDNKKGNLVAKLLRIAFDRKLMFTIGSSRTTGAEGVVTWNGIHHKTRMEGGPQRFGYPDDTYLDRVLDELAAKGVTEESLNDP